MDKSIIREFAKLRVLTPYDFQRMDELVKDLTNALEESSSSNVAAMKHQQQKRRGGRRRRPIKLMTSSLNSPSTGRQMGRVSNRGPIVSPSAVADAFLLGCSEDSVSSIDIETGIAKNDVGSIGTGRQSDSDCCQVSGSRTRPIVVGRSSVSQETQQKPFFLVGSFAESDSVNENFSPVRPHRRKRKFKRMAIDPSATLGSDPSNDVIRMLQRETESKSAPLLLRRGDLIDGHGYLDMDVLRSPILPGKRKHSTRERSLELMEGEIALQVAGKNLGSMVISEASSEPNEEPSTSYSFRTNGGDGTMDLSEEGATYKIVESSSSSLSSSESDAGIYTNDEGREGDDEHSDFYHEGGPACGIPGVFPWWENGHPLEMDEDDRVSEETFQSILTGSFPHMSYGAQQSFKSGVCKLPQMHGREIRAGRRRIRDLRPGFSIVSSMNEKISKFLQNPEQNELWLQPMRKKEMDQVRLKRSATNEAIEGRGRFTAVASLVAETRCVRFSLQLKFSIQLGHLASLYSLNMRSEGSNQDKCPVLTKTRNTTQVVNLDKIGVNTLWSRTAVNEIKRRRRTPPTSPGNEDLTGEHANPIPDENLGNQMLRGMGWEPGTGLGADRDGIKIPIVAHVRPRYHGLGFGPSTSK